MTSAEVALTGSDRVRMHNRFPRFFLTIVVQNVPLHMTDMVTGCDVIPKGFPLEGCTYGQPEVALYPPQWGLLTGNDVIKRHPHARPEVPFVCSLERPRPIYRFLSLSLVICLFPTILLAPSIITQKFVVFGYVVQYSKQSITSAFSLWGYQIT